MAGTGVPLDLASLVSIWLECVLYGAALPLFGAAVWVILRRKGGVNKLMLGAASLLTLLATIHLSMNLTRAFLAFMPNQTNPNGANEYFNQLRDPATDGKYAIFTLQTVVGDLFNIYRLYIIWNHSWRIVVFPVLIFLASITASAISLSVMLTQGGAPVDALYTSVRINGLILAFLALITLQPLVTSSLIALKLVVSERTLHRAAGVYGAGKNTRGSLLPIARIVLDSAGAYVLTMLGMVVLFVSGSTVFFVFLEAVVPVIAITFCSIIIRIEAHSSALKLPQPVSSESHTPAPPSHSRASTLTGKRSRTPEDRVYSNPVVITVSTERLSGILDVPRVVEEQEEQEETRVVTWPFAEDV
ncbi:hypothetical protein DACRYDRAFT_105401 [Dacryopinax primogenitus]|uniref:Uncharacterized protein n=1 Tax=Dacryopinax primogenitus (strain DJM 731) TaxID=1858805 RepID=M5GFQ9_DACPD|nr:uncharacterized protein DACRYDRAFT_105401 [Dacryopinax primogenitus]EJU04338.1 hypothetical protein DACRYDRAFT_105401 [Dacryopinax primogenitus]